MGKLRSRFSYLNLYMPAAKLEKRTVQLDKPCLGLQ